jgi:hypothetical protein
VGGERCVYIYIYMNITHTHIYIYHKSILPGCSYSHVQKKHFAYVYIGITMAKKQSVTPIVTIRWGQVEEIRRASVDCLDMRVPLVSCMHAKDKKTDVTFACKLFEILKIYKS